MQAIKSKADAQEVIDRLISSEGFITLWDTSKTIRAVTRIVKTDGFGYYVSYHEDTTGEDWTQYHYLAEIVSIIWDNRKFINRSGQLETI